MGTFSTSYFSPFFSRQGCYVFDGGHSKSLSKSLRGSRQAVPPNMPRWVHVALPLLLGTLPLAAKYLGFPLKDATRKIRVVDWMDQGLIQFKAVSSVCLYFCGKVVILWIYRIALFTGHSSPSTLCSMGLAHLITPGVKPPSSPGKGCPLSLCMLLHGAVAFWRRCAPRSVIPEGGGFSARRRIQTLACLSHPF